MSFTFRLYLPFTFDEKDRAAFERWLDEAGAIPSPPLLGTPPELTARAADVCDRWEPKR